jgi:hypothetical protein
MKIVNHHFGSLFAALLTCASLTFCVDLIGQKEYPFKSFRDTIFYDDFRDNRNDWYSPGFKVKKNKMTVASALKQPPTYSHQLLEFDRTMDYDIRAKFSWYWNRKEKMMGVGWNYDLNSGLFIGFNKKKLLRIIKRHDGYDKVIFERSAPELIYAEFEPMTLVIQKRGDRYDIFLNEVEVYSTLVPEDEGSLIGFFSGMNSGIEAYELFVYYVY